MSPGSPASPGNAGGDRRQRFAIWIVAILILVLAFFGPNTPVLYGPLSAGSTAFHRDLPCSPCITVANYRSSRCRIHSCMASIPTGEVVTTLRRLLDAAPAEVR